MNAPWKRPNIYVRFNEETGWVFCSEGPAKKGHTMTYDADTIACALLAWLANDSGPITHTEEQVAAIKESVAAAQTAGWAPVDDDIDGDICLLAIGAEEEASELLHKFPQLRQAHNVLNAIFEGE